MTAVGAVRDGMTRVLGLITNETAFGPTASADR